MNTGAKTFLISYHRGGADHADTRAPLEAPAQHGSLDIQPEPTDHADTRAPLKAPAQHGS